MAIRFFPKTRFLRILFFTAIFLVILFTLPHYWGNYLYRKAITHAKEQGVELDFLKLAPPEIPYKENAWAILERVFAQMDQHDQTFHEIHQHFAQIEQMTKEILAKKQKLSAEEIANLEREIAPYQTLFEILEPAFEREKCRFLTDYNIVNPAAIAVPNFLHHQRLFTLLQIQCLLDSSKGNREAAYRDLRKMFRFNQWTFEESPFLIAVLIGFNTLRTTCVTLNALECIEPPTQAERESIVREINKFRIHEQFIRSIEFERAVMHEGGERFLAGEFGDVGDQISPLIQFTLRYPGRFIIRANQAYYLETMSKMIEWLHLPAYQSFSHWNHYDPQTDLPAIAFIAKSIMFNCNNVAKRRDETLARLDEVRLSFALFDFKEKNGAYPQELSAIRDAFVGEMPIDPFTGKDYVYQKKENGYLLYSYGKNMQDNGGEYQIDPHNRNEIKDDLIWAIP
ncbi:MAG: hypothetical protein C4527_10790 [Candidatus Omnitrophota bacterium]|jgi:hypothetical protein|nr:MAG: hypothetical protein C4527_10790 [Candidatus Omnitrophota bacterium]